MSDIPDDVVERAATAYVRAKGSPTLAALTAAGYGALLAERDALRAEVATLRAWRAQVINTTAQAFEAFDALTRLMEPTP